MKKVMNFKSLAMIIAMISAACFTSCTPQPEGPDSKEINFTATFTTDITEVVLSSYDITAEILLDDSTLYAEEINTDIWTYTTNLQGVEASRIYCKVVAKAKETLPEYNAEELYLIGISSTNNVKVTKNKQTTNLMPTRDNSVTYIMKYLAGSKIPDYIAKTPTINIVDVEYQLQ